MSLSVMTSIQGASIPISGGTLVSAVMAPIPSAVDGSPTGVLQFFWLSAVGASTTPAFCKFSCSQTDPSTTAAVMDYYNFVVGHAWSFGDYSQTDALDPDTFEATSAVSSTGDPAIWNNQFGYFYTTPPDPDFNSSSGTDWDKSSTRAGILAALGGVDWAALWADGASSYNHFIYDRAQISPNQSGLLPFGPTGNTGAIVPGNAPHGPGLALTGRVGELAGAASASEALGVSLSRTQVQIRGFSGAAIPYFIYETADGAASITIKGNPGSTVRSVDAISLTGTDTFYRHVSDGTWTHDLQIIQLPDAAMDGPASISTTFGDRVRNGTAIGMVVGMSFEDFMLGLLGPTWADFIFT